MKTKVLRSLHLFAALGLLGWTVAALAARSPTGIDSLLSAGGSGTGLVTVPVPGPAERQGYTRIASPAAGELGIGDIIAQRLGVPSGGATFDPSATGPQVLGAYTFTRVRDGSPMGLAGLSVDIASPVLSGVTDQYWTSGGAGLATRVHYASRVVVLGTATAATGFSPVAFVGGGRTLQPDVQWLGGPAGLDSPAWTWACADDLTGAGHRVDSAGTADGAPRTPDRMITYLAQGTGPGGPRFSWWVFCDLSAEPGLAGDFNDLVLEFTVIPAPAGFVLVGCGWAVLTGLRRRLTA